VGAGSCLGRCWESVSVSGAKREYKIAGRGWDRAPPNALILRIDSMPVPSGDGAVNSALGKTVETGGHGSHGTGIQVSATLSENPGDAYRFAGDMTEGSSDGVWRAATNPHSPENGASNGAVMLGSIDSPTSAVSA
jgi:hypothetical protein